MKPSRSTSVPDFFFTQGDSNYLADGRIDEHVPVKLAPAIDFQPFPVESIDLIDFSSRYGVMIHCLQSDIGVKNLNDLNDEIRILHEQQWRGLGYKLDGVVGLKLSPNQELLAVLCKSELIVLETRELLIRTIHKIVPLKQAGAGNMQWISEKDLLIWRFYGPCMHVNIASGEVTVLKGVKCTAATMINNTIVVTDHNKLHFFSLETFQLLKTISWEDKQANDDFVGLLCAIHIYGIIKINNLQYNEWRKDDAYVVVGVFYVELDDYDNNNSKSLYFARGNIFEDQVQFRGGGGFFTNNKDDRLFSSAEGVKKPFSLKTVLFPELHFLAIGLSKVEKLYLVDTSNPFEKLKEIDLELKYEFKSEFSLIGFAFMANKLKFESEYHGPMPDTKLSVQKYHGNFLSVAFREMDLDFLVPFPISILAVNFRGEFTKQYLVAMEYALDDRDPQRRNRGIEVIMRNCPIVEPIAKLLMRAEIPTGVPENCKIDKPSDAEVEKKEETRPTEAQVEKISETKPNEPPSIPSAPPVPSVSLDSPAHPASALTAVVSPISVDLPVPPILPAPASTVIKSQSGNPPEVKIQVNTENKREQTAPTPPGPIPRKDPPGNKEAPPEIPRQSAPSVEESKSEINKLDISSRIEYSSDSKKTKPAFKYNDRIEVQVNIQERSTFDRVTDPKGEAEKLFVLPPPKPKEPEKPSLPASTNPFSSFRDGGNTATSIFGSIPIPSKAAEVKKEPEVSLKDSVNMAAPLPSTFFSSAALNSLQKPSSTGFTKPTEPSTATKPLPSGTDKEKQKDKAPVPNPIEAKFKQYAPIYKKGKEALTRFGQNLKVYKQDIQENIHKTWQCNEEIKGFPDLISQLSKFMKITDKADEDVKINEICVDTSPAKSQQTLDRLKKLQLEYNMNSVKYKEIMNSLFAKEAQKFKPTNRETEMKRYSTYYEEKNQELQKKISALEADRKQKRWKRTLQERNINKLSFKFVDEDELPENSESLGMFQKKKVVRVTTEEPFIRLPNLLDVKPKPGQPTAVNRLAQVRQQTGSQSATAPTGSAFGPRKPEPPKREEQTKPATVEHTKGTLSGNKPNESKDELPPMKLTQQVSQIQKKPDQKPVGEAKPSNTLFGNLKKQEASSTIPASKLPQAPKPSAPDQPDKTTSGAPAGTSTLFGPKKEETFGGLSGAGLFDKSKTKQTVGNQPINSAAGTNSSNTSSLFAGISLAEVHPKPDDTRPTVPSATTEAPKTIMPATSLISQTQPANQQPAQPDQPTESQPVQSQLTKPEQNNPAAQSTNPFSKFNPMQPSTASQPPISQPAISQPTTTTLFVSNPSNSLTSGNTQAEHHRPVAFGVGNSSFFGKNTNDAQQQQQSTPITSGFSSFARNNLGLGNSNNMGMNTGAPSNPLMPAGGGSTPNIFNNPQQQPVGATNNYTNPAGVTQQTNIFNSSQPQQQNIFNNPAMGQQSTNTFQQQQPGNYQQNTNNIFANLSPPNPQQQGGQNMFATSYNAQPQQQQAQQSGWSNQQQNNQFGQNSAGLAQPPTSFWGQQVNNQPTNAIASPANIFGAVNQSHDHHNKPTSGIFAMRK